MTTTFPLVGTYQKDIQRAVNILQQAGCTHIYLFGSAARGQLREGSDIDLAVRGCPQTDFFRLLGKLLLELDHSVDLIDLDTEIDFAHFLEREGELRQIA